MDLPTVSLTTFLASSPSSSGSRSEEAIAEARKAAESLILTGALVVRDDRASKAANDRFLDLFEDYFAQDDEGLKVDERPEWGYQVGVTLENTEKPKCGSDEECLSIISQLEEAERPIDLSGHAADPKCRFFHRMADMPPYKSHFPISEIPNVTPKAFEQDWKDRVNEWGGCMKQAVEGVARMVAVGLGLDETTFLDAGRYGIYAGFHTDLNFLTIHGQSRYPGLHIWARNSGKRIAVKIPPGCLLVQAGKQIEWMTGGLIKGEFFWCSGFHEVVGTQGTLDAMERRRREYPGRPLIRISSTFFWHLSPDHQLLPVPRLSEDAEKRFGVQKQYGTMLVGDQVRHELGLIALMAAS